MLVMVFISKSNLHCGKDFYLSILIPHECMDIFSFNSDQAPYLQVMPSLTGCVPDRGVNSSDRRMTVIHETCTLAVTAEALFSHFL